MSHLRNLAKISAGVCLPNTWPSNTTAGAIPQVPIHRAVVKEIWVQAALEIFQALPVDWEKVKDEENLRQLLNNLESSFKNLDFRSKEQ